MSFEKAFMFFKLFNKLTNFQNKKVAFAVTLL